METVYIKYFWQKLTCLCIGHDWYIVDYFLGMENNHINYDNK
jgi:hypothetical protein